LPCTYLLIPKKKGPKGPSTRTPRAVLKMRMNQEQSAKSDASLPDIRPAMSPPLVAPANRGFQPSPLLSMEVVDKYLDSFYTHKYRLLPESPISKHITNLSKLFSQFWIGIDSKIL